MKFYIKNTLFVLLAIALISSCKKDDDSKPTPSNTIDREQYMRAYFDGVPTDLRVFALSDSGTVIIGGFFNQTDYPQLLLALSDTLKENTYNIPSGSPSVFLYYVHNNDSALFPTEGKVVLEVMDLKNRRVSGKFEGKMKGFTPNSKDSIVVEQGEFNVFY